MKFLFFIVINKHNVHPLIKISYRDASRVIIPKSTRKYKKHTDLRGIYDFLLRSLSTMTASNQDLVLQVQRLLEKVYKALGPGYPEIVYRKSLELELQDAGVSYESECAIPVYYNDMCVSFIRADLIIAKKIVVEVHFICYVYFVSM